MSDFICVQCGMHGVMRDFDGEERRIPKPGDLSLCTSCGFVAVITEGFEHRKLTDDEWESLPDDSKAELTSAREVIAEHAAELRELHRGVEAYAHLMFANALLAACLRIKYQ